MPVFFYLGGGGGTSDPRPTCAVCYVYIGATNSYVLYSFMKVIYICSQYTSLYNMFVPFSTLLLSYVLR